MRTYGALHPTEQVPKPADTVLTLLIAGSSGQALDWPSGAEIVCFSGRSTAGAQLNFEVNLESTRAAAPSSGQSTIGTTCAYPVLGQRFFQIPGGSTGFSVAALSSGYVTAEVWGL